MIRFPNFEGNIRPPVILERGEGVWKDNLIRSVEVKQGTWSAKVVSESQRGVSYKISLKIANNKVTNHKCNCPYRQGPICKHRVALLFEIKHSGTIYEENDEDEFDIYEDEEEEEEEDEDDEEEDDELDELTNSSKPIRLTKMNTMPNLTQKIEKVEEPEEDLIGPNIVHREFDCQICLGTIHKPVLLPCESHSMCQACLAQIISTKKREKDGYKHIFCPTCGDKSGIKKVKKIEDFKCNKELERIHKAYKEERKLWVDERLKLESDLASTQAMTQDLKNNVSMTQAQLSQPLAIKEEKRDVVEAIKDQKKEEEEEKKSVSKDCVDEITRKFVSLTTSQLKSVLEAAIENMKARGENLDEFFKPKPQLSISMSTILNTQMNVELPELVVGKDKKRESEKQSAPPLISTHIIKTPEIQMKTNRLIRKSDTMTVVDELRSFLLKKPKK